MAGLGFPEIMVILVVALIVFGPRKLPELGKSLGAGLREFRRSTQGLKDEFDAVLKDTDPAAPVTQSTVHPAPVTVISAQPQVVQPQVVRAQDAVAVPQPAVQAAVTAGGHETP